MGFLIFGTRPSTPPPPPPSNNGNGNANGANNGNGSGTTSDPNAGNNTPPANDSQPSGNGTSSGDTSGGGNTGSGGSSTGGTTGGSTSGETGTAGSASGGTTSGGTTQAPSQGTSGSGRANTVSPSSNRNAAPAAEKTGLDLDRFITDESRLDLAFSQTFDETVARRYAEATRQMLVSKSQLAQLAIPDSARPNLGRDAETVRRFDEPAQSSRYDKAA